MPDIFHGTLVNAISLSDILLRNVGQQGVFARPTRLDMALILAGRLRLDNIPLYRPPLDGRPIQAEVGLIFPVAG